MTERQIAAWFERYGLWVNVLGACVMAANLYACADTGPVWLTVAYAALFVVNGLFALEELRRRRGRQ